MLKSPASIIRGENSYCPGCGHGIFDNILTSVIEEMGIAEKVCCSVDIACSYLTTNNVLIDYVQGAHGRMGAVATAMKRVRPDNIVIGRCGDGAAYAIGIGETLNAAIRNENICMFVINNSVYGMTGGQMAPTTLPNQVTTSSPKGKDITQYGNPVNCVDLMGNLDIAYLARGSVSGFKNVQNLKKIVRKALQKQIDGEGFCFVEVMSPCPTNWNMAPLKALDHLDNEVLKYYPLGEFIDKGANK